MELTWHNCTTHPPKERRNNTLYVTDGEFVNRVIYDKRDGWYNLATYEFMPQTTLHKFWWADIEQTARKTPEFKEAADA